MIDSSSIDTLPGTKVLDADGDKVGTVGQVYLDDTDGSPLFATVRTGLFGNSESFIPLRDADFTGGSLRVAYQKAMIKDAPKTEADGELNEDEQDRLFDYYGLTTSSTNRDQQPSDGRTPTDGVQPSPDMASPETTGHDRTDITPRNGAPGNHPDTARGHDVSGPTTDDAMTRSEERLHVGTQQVQTGRARLRKHIVTERQSVTVPVTHEEARIQREPITDANRGDALSGGDLTEEEHEVTLTEERPVVDKETVPVERVRLGTEQVIEQRQVTEDVRHEEIEQVDPDRTNRS